MKQNKIIYWIPTVIVGAFMLLSGVMYFISPQALDGFKKIGFPDYFRVELGVAKIIGALVLLVPQIPDRIKEWAYVGFGITFISAIVAHLGSGDGWVKAGGPIVALLLLSVSYIYYHKLNEA